MGGCGGVCRHTVDKTQVQRLSHAQGLSSTVDLRKVECDYDAGSDMPGRQSFEER